VDIRFGTGDATLAPAAAAQLAAAAREARDDANVTISLVHSFGRGDLERAEVSANPSRADSDALRERLLVRRDDLERRRAGAAVEARAGLTAGDERAFEEAADAAGRLDEELGATESALDAVYDLGRRGAERLADHRTREAARALGAARLEAVRRALVAAGAPEGTRLRIRRVRIEEPSGDDPGTVVAKIIRKPPK
jgi:hypothetical protein